MKNVLALTSVVSLVSLVSLLSVGCDKGGSGGAGGAGGSGSAASTAAAPDCEKVVEKIASLNPPDMRGDSEKKLWRSMCAEMKPEQKTCVLGAGTMDDMKKCMK
jgi:hypothetical protein